MVPYVGRRALLALLVGVVLLLGGATYLRTGDPRLVITTYTAPSKNIVQPQRMTSTHTQDKADSTPAAAKLSQNASSQALVSPIPNLQPTKKPQPPQCPPDLSFRPHENDRFKNLSLRFARKSTNYKRRDTYDEPLVILVPISNAARYLERLMKNLCSLTYPHELISIVLGEDSSTDNTYEDALSYLMRMQQYFRNVKLFSLKGKMPQRPASMRHELSFQLTRRKHLANSRNQLLFAGLRDEAWVLWVDSDVQYIPTDLIERLMSSEKEIVAPACMYIKNVGQTDVYDRNTWKETPESLDFQRRQPHNFLMLEGYEPTIRKYLSDLRGDSPVVEIDGVGGCILLVKADVHRNGVVFPPFVFEHHIETEGLAKMAREMGHLSYGMPYVEVFHS